MRVGFIEVKQLCRENADRLAELAEHHGRKLDALAEAGAERDRKLEFLAVRTDALRTEIRLVWGALGILVTVLLAVFGLLFALTGWIGGTPPDRVHLHAPPGMRTTATAGSAALQSGTAGRRPADVVSLCAVMNREQSDPTPLAVVPCAAL